MISRIASPKRGSTPPRFIRAGISLMSCLAAPERAVLSNGGKVLRSGIAEVPFEPILRIEGSHLSHHPVSLRFGQNRSGRNAGEFSVSLDDRLSFALEGYRDFVAINEYPLRWKAQ